MVRVVSYPQDYTLRVNRRQELGEVLEVVVRTVHLVASAAWVGGSLFYALVLRPQLRRWEQATSLSRSHGHAFGRVVSLSAWLLLASGGYLTFARLTNPSLGAPYVLVLGLKILLAVWMMLLAGALSRNRGKPPVAASRVPALWRGVMPVPTLILLLGLIIFLLSAVLTTIYQATPASQ